MRERREFWFFSPVGFGTASSQIQNRIGISLLASGSEAGDGTVRGHTGQSRQGQKGSGERPSRAGTGSTPSPRPRKPLCFATWAELAGGDHGAARLLGDGTEARRDPPGSGQPHVPSFPAIPAKTKGEEAALPPARFVLARSAAAAGQPRSPPPPLRLPLRRRGCRKGGPGRDAGAQSKCGLRGWFCSLSSPACVALGAAQGTASASAGRSGARLFPHPPGSSSLQPSPEARGCAGVWKPHQSGARGGWLCPGLPSRCRGCRAGWDAAAARLWANAKLLGAVEKGREGRGLEKGPYTRRRALLGGAPGKGNAPVEERGLPGSGNRDDGKGREGGRSARLGVSALPTRVSRRH